MLYLVRLAAIALLTALLLPFLALIAVTLLFFNLVHMMTHFSRRPAPSLDAPLSGLASIIVLNWNGKDLLAQGLPSILDAVAADGRAHEVIVVDNGSSDGSCDFVRRSFPGVRLIALEENLGFAEGNNEGVRAASHDVVVLLNNDMVVDRGFLRPLLEGFGPKTFAVTSQIFLQDAAARREETGKTTAVFRRGMVDYSHAPLDGRELRRPYYPAFWAGGGSSAYHRAKFLALGGFSEIYSPAYVEDADLSYLAWRVGWEVLFAPASVVYHKHRASSRRRFGPTELQVLVQRNQLLFLWKNLRSWRLLLSHCAFLPWTCYRVARDQSVAVWRGVLQAALRIPDLEIDKLGTPFRRERSDLDVFALFGNPARYFGGYRAPADPSDPRPRVLWVTAYIPHAGRHAGAARMYQLLRRISGSYRVTLLSFLETDEERAFVDDLVPLCEKIETMRRRPPPRWQLFPYEPFDEFRTGNMAEAVARCLEDQDFALMQLEYSQMGCYADRTLGLPTLITKHEVDFAACARRARVETKVLRKLRWFYNYLQVLDREVRLLRDVDAAICMTDPDAEALRRFCRDLPIHVVNTGVDLEYFAPPAVRETRPRLVFVGAFQHHPNVDAILHFTTRILPAIRKRVPATEFLIVGSNPPPAIASLADHPGIVVTGFVPDIRPYMASSSVYVVPLRLGVGIRGKILEAWSMAMAVVATPVACAGLRYENGTNLLVADDDESFANAVVSLVNDPAARERLGMEGRKVAEAHYGWNASAAQLQDLYERYVRSGRTPLHIPAQKEAGTKR